MKARRHHLIALATAAAIVLGVGTTVALAQSEESPSPTDSLGNSEETEARAEAKDAFLDGVAERLGIDRSRLDGALQAIALDEVEWALENGFITEAQADAVREAIESGESGAGSHELHGGFGPPGLRGAPFDGGLDGPEVLVEAAEYLELSVVELHKALGESTLAELAGEAGKSVDGLEQALRDAKAAQLSEAVDAGVITADQMTVLLERFDSQVGDLVNGVSPLLTELAERLGVERSALVEAIEGAAIDQVNAALEGGLITEAQAAELRERIRAGHGLPFGGLGHLGGIGLGGIAFGGFGGFHHCGPGGPWDRGPGGFGPGGFGPGEFGPGMASDGSTTEAFVM